MQARPRLRRQLPCSPWSSPGVATFPSSSPLWSNLNSSCESSREPQKGQRIQKPEGLGLWKLADLRTDWC